MVEIEFIGESFYTVQVKVCQGKVLGNQGKGKSVKGFNLSNNYEQIIYLKRRNMQEAVQKLHQS